MLYRKNPKNGKELSILGYGCLRFTKKGGVIDQKKAEEEMKAAIENGVNYFDTAYTYHGSEVCLGKFLAKGYRDKVNIATKLPHYYIKTIEDMEKCFEEQLQRLQTDHIEYYLMHMLNDAATWKRLTDLGMEAWIAGKKAEGKIENIGFSFHGATEQFIKIIDAYDWDFCQIQFNYMDEHSQAGLRGLQYAAGKGLPVIIMEPLRGGRLVQGLPESAKRVFEKTTPKRSPAEWGLRWVWNHPEVTVILSGMNEIEQVEENVRIASEAKADSLSKEELEVFEQVKQEINKKSKYRVPDVLIVCRVRRAWIFQDVFRHIICGIPMAGMQDLRRISCVQHFGKIRRMLQNVSAVANVNSIVRRVFRSGKN